MVAHQAPLFMGFSRQEHYSGLPFPPAEELPDPGIEALSLVSSALAGGFFTTGTTREAPQTNGRTTNVDLSDPTGSRPPNPGLGAEQPVWHVCWLRKTGRKIRMEIKS